MKQAITQSILITTATGSVYAIWHDPATGWWLRPRATLNPHAFPLDDDWRAIHEPEPWPIKLGDRIYFRFRQNRIMRMGDSPGFLVELEDEWRVTTAVRMIGTWGEDDVWPGLPGKDDA